MMKSRLVLGLDISLEHVAAAVVERGPRSTARLKGWAWRPLGGELSRQEVLAELLHELGWRSGRCILGLPLSVLALRNMEVVFQDRRRIQQVLPLELEDQLLEPVERHEVDFLVTGRGETGSRLLVAAVDREWLDRLTADLMASGLDPDRILVSAGSLSRHQEQDQVFVHGGVDGISLVVVSAGRPLFMRRLTGRGHYDPRQTVDHNNNLAMTEELAEALGDEIAFSLGGLARILGQEQPEWPLCLTGMLRGDEGWRNDLANRCGLECEHQPLASQVSLLPEELSQAETAILEPCLALALARRSGRGGELDFRGQMPSLLRFFKPRTLVWMAVAAGCMIALVLVALAVDTRRLRAKTDRLGNEMRAIYRQIFPDATRIVDPLVQMEARLRQEQEPGAVLPLFLRGRRCLDLLADLSARIPASIKVHVSRLVIDQRLVQIRGTTSTFNEVDTIRNHLAASPLYDQVKIVSAAADKKKSAIRFELSLTLREERP